MRSAALALVAVLACGPNGDTPAAAADGGELRLQTVAEGLESPVHVTSPRGDDRLFVVEQPGRIRIVRNSTVEPTPFLDIADRVSAGGERGLLSVAFHPDFASNGRFFVNYTDRTGDTRVEEYRVGSDPDEADPGSARLILAVDQPYANHNGGLLVFGPDGMLYIGMGDGGAAGDPLGHGQNPGTLLGALLRIDVDGGEPYAIPPDNPFVGRPDARGEVWAYGLRNPWRFAFDREAGLLYIADVGQNRWEEVNVEPADRAGANYGWDIMEGRHCFAAPDCDTAGLVLPALEYSHDEGCSITGGHPYRGERLPGLAGHYFYSDWCGGWVRSFRWQDGAVTDRRSWFGDVGRVTTFGEDGAGELYLATQEGTVYRLAPGS